MAKSTVGLVHNLHKTTENNKYMNSTQPMAHTIHNSP